ncbi:hypothetical protein [Sphingomonas kyeonggiensis]|uniref:Up-regulated in Daf-2 domain-containing protein n=1 Tax=Sphingomonas kyeonggiensis TaxID=1268553 RepID=A0A7W6JRR6_9SPHN|nr:hypothetical protein [Sphingomonas kyeonggiensis]MBB4098373.1 hypothetical protein [Sphingomonas kyeonggiensis]
MTTENTASAVITNNSSKTFVSIGLSHKYSDVYSSKAGWENLAPGQTTSPALAVEYNTGFGTTGEDWWFLLAVDSQGNVWNTDPSNARWLWDKVDWGIANFGEVIAEGLDATGPETLGAGDVAGVLMEVLTAATNDTSVEGYKEFLLRDEDAGNTVTITLTDTNIHFSAPSGTADTPLALAQAAPKPANA